MDNDYKVGALCDLIASKGKKKKTQNNEIKNKQYEHVENQLDAKINNIKSHKKENLKKSKKRSLSETTPNELSKKIKINTNTLVTKPKGIVDEKLQTFNQKNNNNPELLVPSVLKEKKRQMVNDTKIDLNTSNTFDKIIKKKKKSVGNLIQSNDKTVIKRNSMSKLPNIKSSAEYLEKESRTVFVGNVPVNIKMSAVKNLFKKFGEIETTRLRSVAVKNLDKPKRVSIIKGDFHPQRDTANVYVRFKTIEQAQSSLALNATQFEGHTIRVDMALSTSHKQNKKKGIFIGNLPYSVQEDDIWDFFKECGAISAVRIVRDNATGVSKGFGYVDFESKESVELAIQLQGKRTQNRVIRIKRIETKANVTKANKMVNKTPIQFKRNKPIGSSQNFQGEIMKPKMQKKKQKPTKTELMRKKIAKKLN